MSDPRRALESVRSVLLVDWPNTGVPRALLAAGRDVYGYCPDRYTAAELLAEPPADSDGVYAPAPGETGYLVFLTLDRPPSQVDLVCAYRPEVEIPDIVARHAVPLGARALWLQPPNTSALARQAAMDNGLEYVEGADIAEAAWTLKTSAA